MSIANLDLRDYLSDGDTVHKAYGTYPTTQSYTKGTAITIPDYSGIDESLVVDTAKVAPMYIGNCVFTWRQVLKNFVNCWNILLNILAKTEYLKWYKRTMLENNMLGTISSQA